MSKKNPKFASVSFVAVPRQMLFSAARKDMQHSSASALDFFINKAGFYVEEKEFYSHEFEFHYKEARDWCGFNSNTFMRVVLDLIAHGFIEVASQGGLVGVKKVPTKYRMSRRWQNWVPPES